MTPPRRALLGVPSRERSPQSLHAELSRSFRRWHVVARDRSVAPARSSGVNESIDAVGAVAPVGVPASTSVRGVESFSMLDSSLYPKKGPSSWRGFLNKGGE